VNTTSQQVPPRRQRWWIDRLNRFPSSHRQVVVVWDWARAELAQVRKYRPQDEAGWERMITAAIASVLVQMPGHHPAPEYAAGWPPLPGGGWEPNPYTGGQTAVEHP